MFKSIWNKNKFNTIAFEDYSDYLKIQYRTDPKEFLDGRLRIVSSFVYLLPIIKSLGLSKPVKEESDAIKGQLVGDDIYILDAGCRDGWTIEFLNSIGYRNVLGIELFDEYVNYCNQRGRKAEKGDLHNLTYKDNTFDMVYCRHVLEHCLDPVKVMDEMLRVVKQGGVVYCAFPLEQETFGKHTTAIPDVETAQNILKGVSSKYKIIHCDLSEKTGIVIPEEKELAIFVQKI